MSTSRIIQLTDTHLFGKPPGRLLGADTNSSFSTVLSHIIESKINPDYFLLTGDLTQDETLASYQWLKEQLDPLGVPHYWLCGNHDQQDLMHQASPSSMVKHKIVGRWQLILLNSQIPGEVPGWLNETELSLLDRCLSSNPGLHSLIAMHHQPYTIGTQWLNGLNLKNADQLLEVLSRHNNAKLVLNGHIHQDLDTMLGPVRCLSTPSTCVQFKPGTHEFALDKSYPGYRIIDLHDPGEIQTKVVRVESYSPQIDEVAGGY